MSQLRATVEQIVFARNYTRGILDTISEDDWFRMPVEGVTHVAWQVGHLAFAQYRLGMIRLRGERPEDERLFSKEFFAMVKADSRPVSDPSQYPPAAEIRATFDRVHEQLLRELPAFPESDLDTSISPPHKLCKTKLDSLRWCAAHEMVHAGQIGLLRRLFGQKPIW